MYYFVIGMFTGDLWAKIRSCFDCVYLDTQRYMRFHTHELLAYSMGAALRIPYWPSA